MKMICKCKCFYNDRLYMKGQSVEVDEKDLDKDIIKSSFRKADEADTAPKNEDADVPKDQLSKDEIKRRLEGMNVAFRRNASRDVLNKLYQEQLAIQADLQE